jgi:hypothetical protein
MMLLIVLGVTLLTLGVLPPFHRQVVLQSTGVAGTPALPSTQESSQCRPSVSNWFIDHSHPVSGTASPAGTTVTVTGAMMWFQGQLITTNPQPERCIHILIIHPIPAGDNTGMWQAGP